MARKSTRTFSVTITVDSDAAPHLREALTYLARDVSKAANRYPTRNQDPNTERYMVKKVAGAIATAAQSGEYKEEA